VRSAIGEKIEGYVMLLAFLCTLIAAMVSLQLIQDRLAQRQ
jgi:hypothetical protein